MPGHVHQGAVESPQGIEPQQLAKHGRGAAGRGGEVEHLRRQAGDHAVVDDDARLVQHQTVAGRADLHVGELARVHPIQERPGLRPMNLDLAERADIDEPDAASAPPALRHRCSARGSRRSPHSIRGAASFPPASRPRRVRDARASSGVRRSILKLRPGEQLQRDRMVHRARGGQPQLLDARRPRTRAKIAQRVHVRMLALRGPHADGAVALEQFARIEAFLRGVLQVLDLQILVEVDEVLAAADDR